MTLSNCFNVALVIGSGARLSSTNRHDRQMFATLYDCFCVADFIVIDHLHFTIYGVVTVDLVVHGI